MSALLWLWRHSNNHEDPTETRRYEVHKMLSISIAERHRNITCKCKL